MERPLVLAIETNPSQAAAIQQVVCGLIKCELTIVESVEQALCALETRPPALILLPALVSPAEEAQILAALRVLPSGAHVETEITPIFRDVDEVRLFQRWRSLGTRPQPKEPRDDTRHAFAERVRWSISRARERRSGLEEGRTLYDPSLVGLADERATRSPGELVLTDGDSFGLAEASRLIALSAEPLMGEHHADRRGHPRFTAQELSGLRGARIKFGPLVSLVDLSAGGALVETPARLRPEAEAVLELVANARHATVRFRVLRSRTLADDGTPRHLGAFAFAQPLDLADLLQSSSLAARPDAERRQAEIAWAAQMTGCNPRMLAAVSNAW